MLRTAMHSTKVTFQNSNVARRDLDYLKRFKSIKATSYVFIHYRQGYNQAEDGCCFPGP